MSVASTLRSVLRSVSRRVDSAAPRSGEGNRDAFAPSASTPARGATGALGRVEPQLRDLMALAGPARALPSWARSLRTRHGGQFLSRVRGRGMEYDESRPYQPGDDIRQLDWRVTARTGRPHTKLFREERERPVFVCVDYRHGMFFGTRGVFKSVQAARLASLLAWRGQHSGDRVGGLVFGDHEHHELPPRRGQAALVRLLSQLTGHAAAWRARALAAPGEAALLDVVVRLRRLAKPGSLIFFVSDFDGFDEAVAREFARLGAHCDVALVAVHDAFEASFPVLDAGAGLTDTRSTLRLGGVSEQQRAAYAERFVARQAALERACREQRFPFASVTTAGDPVAGLFRMLSA
ncbi:MAG: DUF58 domain-containing protein [Gammaproteobacteria bacterium]